MTVKSRFPSAFHEKNINSAVAMHDTTDRDIQLPKNWYNTFSYPVTAFTSVYIYLRSIRSRKTYRRTADG
jgi:hypothetical protein